MDLTGLYDLAARQRGLVALQQSRVLGLDASTLASHFTRRGWRRAAPGVWLAPGAPAPDRMHLRVAVLAVGAPVAVARWSAASVHGLHPPHPIAQVLVPHGRRAAELPRVHTLRSRTWSDLDVCWIDGIPVTTMARTLCDLAAIADLGALRRLTIDGIQRRLVTLAKLVEQLARAGRIRGRRKLARICRELDRDLVDSEFERLVVRWLRSLGYRVVTQHRVVTEDGLVLHLDIAIPDLMIGIECDGFGFHSERRHLSKDASRKNEFEGTDWKVLHLTWDQFTSTRAEFLRQLDRAIATRTP